MIIFGIRRYTYKKSFPDGFIGYMSLGIFSISMFFLEFLSGNRKDIFYDYFSLGLNQIGAITGIIIAIV